MWRCSLAAGGIVLFALIGVTWVAGRHSVHFANLSEARASLAEAGFASYMDHEDERIGTGFLISKQPVSVSQVRMLCKIGPMGPEWKGKAWLTFDFKDWKLASVPDGAAVRKWGEVIAFGDEEVLREIDAAFLVSSLTR